MPFGYNGRIAHVNLTDRTYRVEEPRESFYRTYLGGRGVAVHYLLREVPATADALSPENVLVIAPSVVTGGPVPGTSRFTVAAKGPLTGGYAEAEAGGYFGPELKAAGFDALVIYGRSEKPVYLFVQGGEIAFEDALDIWGTSTVEAQEGIRRVKGDPLIRVLDIGQAGENLVRYACVVTDGKHVAGRSGLGAVMGSKQLKAVAVRGRRRPEQAAPEALRAIAQDFARHFHENADDEQLNRYGTSQYFLNINKAGLCTTRNWQGGELPGAEKVAHEALHEELVVGSDSCYACSVRCKRVVQAKEPYDVDPSYGGPEFECMTSFSAILGCTDLHVMVKANELSNRYGLDSIATGASIAFAMECFERGILTPEDTGGIDLRFGNAEAVLPMVELIASRKGLGKLLGEGVARAAKSLGRGAERYAMHVKGQEFPMHDPRGKYGVGLAYAVSPTGADHLQHEHDGAFDPQLSGYSHQADVPSFFSQQSMALGVYEPVPSLSIGSPKVRLFAYLQHYWSMFNMLDLCIFTFAPVRYIKVNRIPEIVGAMTGWDVSLWELMKAGERGTTLTRVFNLKHGLTSADDRLPERMFEPLDSGAMKGAKLPREEFYQSIPIYYDMMGWDPKAGIPTSGKLAELGVAWASAHLPA